MSSFFDGIAAVARGIAEDRGPFTLFAVMHRSDTPQWWDVVVAAPWLDTEGIADYRYLTAKLKNYFTWDETPRISHVAILELTNPVVIGLLATRDLEVGRVCAMVEPAGPVDFDKGYLVTREAPASAAPKGKGPKAKPVRAARAAQGSSS